MKKEFVPYEIALALKELGFNESCFGFYSQNIGLIVYQDSPNDYNYLEGAIQNIKAPTFSQAFRFFREKFQKNTVIFSDGYQWTFDLRWVDEDSLYKYPTIQFPKREVGREWFDTYEDVEIGGLQKLIEIVKEQNYEK